MKRFGVAALALAVWAGPAWADDGGEAVFKSSCGACHSLSQNRVGPPLAGVVGRAAGEVSNYLYSAAIRNSGLIWTEDKLDAFLISPKTVVPDTKMTFNGIRDAVRRQALIAYLKSH